MSNADAVCTDSTRCLPGGSRLVNAARRTKKLVGDGLCATSAKLTPCLISVLGLRSSMLCWARRLHDDRWGDLLLKMDAAARSFRAVQLGREVLLVAAGDSRNQPLPSSFSTSSLSLGFAWRTNLLYLLYNLRLQKRLLRHYLAPAHSWPPLLTLVEYGVPTAVACGLLSLRF